MKNVNKVAESPSIQSGYDTYKTIDIQVNNGVLNLIINNPPFNVLDNSLIKDLKDFAIKIKDDQSVKVIVFESANPEFFIAHGDINFVTNPELLFSLADEDGDPNLNPMQQLHERLRNLPQVTIAKMSGYARGGGNELAMALDMRFASAGKTWLAQPEALMGIIPGGGGTQYLTKLVGRARALELILGAELIDSRRAEKLGIINQEIQAEELDQFVQTLSQRIANLLPGVANAAKIAISEALTQTNGIAVENMMLGQVFLPAAAERMLAVLKADAVTLEGERNLEGILNRLNSADSVN